MALRGLIFTFLFSTVLMGQTKRLAPPDLKITLEQLPVLAHQTAIIPLQVKITNVSAHRGSIIIPFHQNFGKALFQLLVYEIDSNNNYRLIYTSPTELDMDTSKFKANEGFWHLEPGAHYILPLFLNDSVNALFRYESSIAIPNLKGGNYAFQILYKPETSPYFKYAFRENDSVDPIPEDGVSDYPDHFIWEGSFASNMLNFPFELLPVQRVLQYKTSALCTAIFKQQWKKVKRKWGKRLAGPPCDCIVWVYDWPQTIQMSLPAFANYDAILWTNEGIKYVNFNYQLGKIYRGRSRVAWAFYAVGFRRPPFETSKVNWSKLIRVHVWN